MSPHLASPCSPTGCCRRPMPSWPGVPSTTSSPTPSPRYTFLTGDSSSCACPGGCSPARAALRRDRHGRGAGRDGRRPARCDAAGPAAGALPVVAAILVARARLRMSCERSVEPAQVPLGSPMRGQHHPRPGRPAAGRAFCCSRTRCPRELGNRPRFLVDKADLSWRRVVEYPMLGRVRGRFTHRTADGAHHRPVRTGSAGSAVRRHHAR